jgi:DNA-binding response OmpR family regulator
MTAKRILIVEDEKAIRDLVAFGLRRAGYEVREAEDCREARARIVDVRPDLMLVDWMLPDMSGLELTRSLKRAKDTEEIPVIMLTARAEEQDKVGGLEGGADDYITKPFSTQELAARVAVQLRRSRTPRSHYGVIMADGLSIDLHRRRATRDSGLIRLTPIEWDLLGVLVSDPGRVFTHQQLFAAVWKRSFGDARLYLRVHITNLRRKIERNPADPRLVITEPGVGYRFILTP